MRRPSTSYAQLRDFVVKIARSPPTQEVKWRYEQILREARLLTAEKFEPQKGRKENEKP